MTNSEKYLKDEKYIFDIAKGIAEAICYDDMEHAKKITEKEIRNWFTSNVKPTLTEDERVKEMVYTKERKREVLATGYYFGLLYYVLSLGTHPTAYVKIPKDNWLCTVKNYDDMPINCHGGITFREDHLYIADNQKIEGEFIGWDYAHCTDYAPYYDEVLSKDTHKWTTKEILEEVKEVCSQIVELGKKPHLTEDERVILRNLNEQIWEKIGRDKYGTLSLKTRTKDDENFFNGCYGHLFQFIKERRRIFH